MSGIEPFVMGALYVVAAIGVLAWVDNHVGLPRTMKASAAVFLLFIALWPVVGLTGGSLWLRRYLRQRRRRVFG